MFPLSIKGRQIFPNELFESNDVDVISAVSFPHKQPLFISANYEISPLGISVGDDYSQGLV
jgi:hypothetical protein